MELLGRVGLMDRAGHRPAELSRPEAALPSHGALVNDPSLILADEPTGNLDSRSGAQILDLLLTLHREGRTILIVTHDETVATRAGRVIHLRDGRIWRGGFSLGGSRSALSIYKLGYLYLASSFFISQLFADGPCCVPSHAVASFLRVSDHTIERISHESWSLILVALTFRRRRWHKHHRSARTGNCFSRIRRSMERLSLRTSVLARCWLTMWNVQKRFMPASTLKCLMPCLRSMPERSVTSSR